MSGYDYGGFLRDVQAHRRTSPTGCWVCDELLPITPGWWSMSGRALDEARRMCEKRSGGIVDAHHLVPKQLLKRERRGGLLEGPIRRDGRLTGGVAVFSPPWTLDRLLMDPRNGIIVRRLHHDQLESRHLAIPVAVLPVDTREFAEDVGLLWWLENQEARRVGPA